MRYTLAYTLARTTILRCTKCEVHDRVLKHVFRCMKKRVPRFLIFEALLRSVLTFQWKIFLSNQVNFLIGQKCFPQKLNIVHISPHIVACWYKLYVNLANLLFNDIFPSVK